MADTTDLKDEFRKYGFIDNVNYIDVTFQNINDKVKFITNDKNKEKINSIRLNGYNLIKRHHLISNRMDTLKKILKPDAITISSAFHFNELQIKKIKKII